MAFDANTIRNVDLAGGPVIDAANGFREFRGVFWASGTGLIWSDDDVGHDKECVVFGRRHDVVRLVPHPFI